MSTGVNRLAIVGFGLIGASLAASLKRAGFAGEIVAVTRSEASAMQAKEQGFVDDAVADLSRGVSGADVVLLAVPMLAMRSVMQSIAPALAASAVLTDAGSVKQSFIDDARAVFGSLKNIVRSSRSGAGSDQPPPARAGIHDGRYPCHTTRG